MGQHRRADTTTVDSDEEDGHTDLIRHRPYTAPMAAAGRSSLSNNTAPLPRQGSKTQNGDTNGDYFIPKTLDPVEAGTDLELNSTVEVCGNPEYCRYGIIRWIGYIRDKNKPIAGLEMVSGAGCHVLCCGDKDIYIVTRYKLQLQKGTIKTIMVARHYEILYYLVAICFHTVARSAAAVNINDMMWLPHLRSWKI